MIPARIIERKRDGEPLPDDELRGFLGNYLEGALPEYQMAAFLMAVYFRGLTDQELDTLVDAIVASGRTLDLTGVADGARVDKHSTGGVGDKVSLVLAPLAAELGVAVPMMSGRGLGHTGGTLDKLEAIPGFRTDLDLESFREVLTDVGCAMIGQTEEIAPLDGRLYRLRDVTATVSSIPLIASSILSKKLAEDLNGLVLDVKVGAGAFLPEPERARELARTMVELGGRRGLPTVAVLTAMDRPLGRAVGNALETAEAFRCLAGEGPEDLAEVVATLVGEMLALAGGADTPLEGRERALDALEGGAAVERAERMVERQGGDPRTVTEPGRLPDAPERVEVRAESDGRVLRVRPVELGYGVVELGGGRLRLGQEIDPRIGFVLDVEPGDSVSAGDRLGTVHAADAEGARRGRRILAGAVEIGEGKVPESLPLIGERITAGEAAGEGG